MPSGLRRSLTLFQLDLVGLHGLGPAIRSRAADGVAGVIMGEVERPGDRANDPLRSESGWQRLAVFGVWLPLRSA